MISVRRATIPHRLPPGLLTKLLQTAGPFSLQHWPPRAPVRHSTDQLFEFESSLPSLFKPSQPQGSPQQCHLDVSLRWRLKAALHRPAQRLRQPEAQTAVGPGRATHPQARHHGRLRRPPPCTPEGPPSTATRPRSRGTGAPLGTAHRPPAAATALPFRSRRGHAPTPRPPSGHAHRQSEPGAGLGPGRGRERDGAPPPTQPRAGPPPECACAPPPGHPRLAQRLFNGRAPG